MKKQILYSLLLSLVVISLTIFIMAIDPAHRTPVETNNAIDAITRPQPEGINLSGFNQERYERENLCVMYSKIFVEQNPGWSLESSTVTSPYNQLKFSHQYAVKDNLVFDPTDAKFYDKDGYKKLFRVSYP